MHQRGAFNANQAFVMCFSLAREAFQMMKYSPILPVADRPRECYISGELGGIEHVGLERRTVGLL
jgi:hypothetical protein